MRQNSNWVQSALESSKQILISASCKYLLSGFARRWRSSFSLFWPTRDVWWCEVLDDRWWFFRSPSRGTMQQSMAGFLSFVGTNLTFTVVAVFQLHRPYLDRQKNFSPKDRTRNSFRPKEFWLLNLRSFRSFVRSEMRYKPCDESFYTSLVRRKS